MPKSSWLAQIKDFLNQPAFGSRKSKAESDRVISQCGLRTLSETTAEYPGGRTTLTISTNQMLGLPPSKEMLNRNADAYRRALKLIAAVVDKRRVHQPLPYNLKEMINQAEEPSLLIDTGNFTATIKAMAMLKKLALSEYDRDRDWTAPSAKLPETELSGRRIRHVMWDSTIMLRFTKEHFRQLAPDRQKLVSDPGTDIINTMARKLVEECYGHTHDDLFEPVRVKLLKLGMDPLREANLYFSVQKIMLSELTIKTVRHILKDQAIWKEQFQVSQHKTIKHLRQEIKGCAEPIMEIVDSEKISIQFRVIHEWRELIESYIKSRLKLYPGSLKAK